MIPLMAVRITGGWVWVGLLALAACQPAATGPHTIVRVRDASGRWVNADSGQGGTGDFTPPPAPDQQQGGPGAQPGQGAPPAQAPGASVEDILPGNPSEMRLGDIGEAIMVYYSLNKTMPGKLTDLGTDQQLNFFSPVSGKEYVYVPSGLRAPGARAPIIVYDPGEGADHTRWCLEMEQNKAGSGMTVVPRQISEATFELYLPK